MSGKKKHPDPNPLIFGPTGVDSVDELLHSASNRTACIASNSHGLVGENPVEAFDIESTSPFYDFYLMCRSPKKFFLSLYALSSDISLWVWIKATAVAMLGVWAYSFAEQQDLYALFRDSVLSAIDPQTMRLLGYRLDIEQLNYKLQVLGLLFSQFRAAVAPFLAVSEVILGSGLLVLGLRFVGVPWQKIHFRKLLLLGLYLKFFYLFALIPDVGPVIATPLALGFGIFAVAKIFELSLWRSIQSYFVVSFLVAEIVAVLALVPLFILGRVFLN